MDAIRSKVGSATITNPTYLTATLKGGISIKPD